MVYLACVRLILLPSARLEYRYAPLAISRLLGFCRRGIREGSLAYFLIIYNLYSS